MCSIEFDIILNFYFDTKLGMSGRDLLNYDSGQGSKGKGSQIASRDIWQDLSALFLARSQIFG